MMCSPAADLVTKVKKENSEFSSGCDCHNACVKVRMAMYDANLTEQLQIMWWQCRNLNHTSQMDKNTFINLR